MAKLSISRAWDETRGVLKRDGKLIATVAAAFIVLPGVIAGLFQPEPEPGKLPAVDSSSLLMIAAILVSLVGQLAIVRLALGPSLSVGDAIRHGLQRFFPFLGAVLLVVAPVVILLGAATQAVGTDAGSASIAASLLLLALLPVIIFFMIRLTLMAPVASAEGAGPIGIIKRSWQLTRGSWWRLFAFFVLWLIAALVVVVAGEAVFGSVAQLLFGDAEGVTVGALLVILVMQVLTAAVAIVAAVMLARIYAQLAGRAPEDAEVSVPTSGT